MKIIVRIKQKTTHGYAHVIPMNTHHIPMCFMGAENGKTAIRGLNEGFGRKFNKNTHKYPCVCEPEARS